jgi:hypothetical protein
MHRLNYAKRILQPSGDVLLALFQQTLAPSLTQTAGESLKPEAMPADASVHKAFGETAVLLRERHLLITSMAVSSPTVELALSTLGAMFETDLLLLDLSRPRAPVICTVFRATSCPNLNDDSFDLALWIARSGSVAMVPRQVKSGRENQGPPSIMLTAHGLTVSPDPFVDEVDRLAGIERAIEAVAKARAAAGVSALPSVPGSTF